MTSGAHSGMCKEIAGNAEEVKLSWRCTVYGYSLMYERCSDSIYDSRT